MLFDTKLNYIYFTKSWELYTNIPKQNLHYKNVYLSFVKLWMPQETSVTENHLSFSADKGLPPFPSIGCCTHIPPGPWQPIDTAFCLLTFFNFHLCLKSNFCGVFVCLFVLVTLNVVWGIKTYFSDIAVFIFLLLLTILILVWLAQLKLKKKLFWWDLSGCVMMISMPVFPVFDFNITKDFERVNLFPLKAL